MAALQRIPAGSLPRACRSCGAPVYWVTTDAGKSMPVSSDVIGGLEPTRTGDGHGVAHFANCPHAKLWRKRGA